MYKAIKKELIDQHNQSQKSNLDFDFEYLEQKLKKSQHRYSRHQRTN